MPSVLSGVRKMNWYFLSLRALLMMLSSEILLEIANEKSVLRFTTRFGKIPPVESVHKDVKLVQDPEGRSHRVPEGQNQRDARGA